MPADVTFNICASGLFLKAGISKFMSLIQAPAQQYYIPMIRDISCRDSGGMLLSNIFKKCLISEVA